MLSIFLIGGCSELLGVWNWVQGTFYTCEMSVCELLEHSACVLYKSVLSTVPSTVPSTLSFM